MKRVCEQIPHAMLSDIELKYCKGCGIYRRLDKFYMNSNPGNYCIECKREQMAKYNALYASLRRQEREDDEPRKEAEERKCRAREYKRRWYAKKKALQGGTVREKKAPKPKKTPTIAFDEVPVGARCKTCKSFSGRTGVKDGWCMRHKRSTKKGRTCPDHKPDERVEYEKEAKMVSVFGG